MQTLGSGHGRPDSPVYTNLQELKISQSSTPPLPSSSPLHTIGDWETHKDQNGRLFYYNHSTQERTWKPPRGRDSLNRKDGKQEMTDTEVHTLRLHTLLQTVMHARINTHTQNQIIKCGLQRGIPPSGTKYSLWPWEMHDGLAKLFLYLLDVYMHAKHSG